ncbi:hypothetical protein Barb4_02511 [Bacteroidales bacterium Barb4]|nr:hypothetical protein Barb4_02511 [Bacteroidales bacterium Barb4]
MFLLRTCVCRLFINAVTALFHPILNAVATGYFLRFPTENFIQTIQNGNCAAKTATGTNVGFNARGNDKNRILMPPYRFPGCRSVQKIGFFNSGHAAFNAFACLSLVNSLFFHSAISIL